jgi:hypothetical protein
MEGIDMPDEIDAEPGTTDGADAAGTKDRDERDSAGAREQGIDTEESSDLSSPRFTVPGSDHRAR